MIGFLVNILLAIIAIPSIVTPPGIIDLPVILSGEQSASFAFDLTYTDGVDFVDYDMVLPPPYEGTCDDHDGLLHCGIHGNGTLIPGGTVLVLQFEAKADARLIFDDVRFFDGDHNLMPYRSYDCYISVIDLWPHDLFIIEK